MRSDSDYDVVEEDIAPEAPPVEAPALVVPPSDEQILAFVQQNIGNPALIAETAAQYGVSVSDLARATGYGEDAVNSYFQSHEVAPPTISAPPVGQPEVPPEFVEPEAPPPKLVEPPPPQPVEPVEKPEDRPVDEVKEPVERPVDKPIVEPRRLPVKAVDEVEPTTEPVTTTPVTTTPVVTADTKPASTLPTITDYQGNQFEGAQILKLAKQLAENAGPMSGGVFETHGANIGFAAEEANKLLGREATTPEQVLIDMSRQLIKAGVTDLNDVHGGDIKKDVSVAQMDDGTYRLFVPDPYDPEGITSSRELTPEEVAKIKTTEIAASGDMDAWTKRVLEDFTVGRGVFSGDKVLSAAQAATDPLSYYIGQTYTGGGGTSYQLNFDPKTGKPTVTASGFSTSDAGLIMPVIMLASNFLMPGVGSALTSTFLEAGLGELASQVVSRSVLSGVTSGIMAEASGGNFGDGFMKGALSGAISAGVAPMIQTALPSDLSPAVANTLTKAGTAVVTAVANGQDPGKVLSTVLLNSAVSNGLSLAAGETGLSTGDAKLLTSVLAPVVTQLVTNGNISGDTLMNTVLMAGSSILANVGSDAVSNATTLKTGNESESTGGDVSSIVNGDNINSVNQLTSGNTANQVTGALSLLSNNDLGNDTVNDVASTVGSGLGALSAANAMGNKLTSLTKTTAPKVSNTKGNVKGAFGVNKPVIPTKIAAKSVPTVNASLAKKTVPTKVNVANLTPVKKTVTPPTKVDVSKLRPLTKMSGLTALKQTPR